MFDLAQTKELAKTVISKYPNAMNPTGYGCCVYEKDERLLGENEHRNCIGGAVFVEAKLPIPEDNGPIDEVIYSDPGVYPFDEEAANFLYRLQKTADGVDVNPVVWSTLDLDEIERESLDSDA